MFSIEDYNYELPEELIAQLPEKRRDDSRLLRVSRWSGEMSHHRFHQLRDLLDSGDVLVLNNTEVIPARLFGKKETGGKVEVFLLDAAQGGFSRASRRTVECECLIRASKRPGPGTTIRFNHGLTARVVHFENGIFRVSFSAPEDFTQTLNRIGHVPLPPYIKRSPPFDDAIDAEYYQTVYASQKGAVAAPTAGLHFSNALLASLKATGINIVEITLHVGYGTFLPVRVNDIRKHRIHSEWYLISDEAAETVNSVRQRGGRVVAVGTTSVRTLEYASDETGLLYPGSGRCDLYIYPGYRFKAVDAVITNYHLPKSTLLMLVSAFAGRERIFAAYREAIRNKYRFYSYGDAMLIV
ncbi:MAG: tRNA preQ1(34) S-adenosylmethionine ribosyltransferase-isomerase QueA [Desulfobacterales bacterium]